MKKRIQKFFSSLWNKHRKLAFSALAFGSASIFTQGLMIIYSIIVANWLGAEKYGFIAAAYAATSLSSFLFNWGFNQYLMKIGSTHPEPKVLGGQIIMIKGFLGVLWGILILSILRLIRPDIYQLNILFLVIIEIWFDSLYGSLIALLLLQNRSKTASQLLVFSRLARLILLILLIILDSKSIVIVLLLRLITTLISFIITWLISKPAFFGFNWHSIRNLFKQSSAYNFSELLSIIFINLDVNILVWLGARSGIIANYSIVISLITAAITLPSGIFNVFLPSLIRSYDEKQTHFKQRIRIVYIVFIILAVIFWITATYLNGPLITTFLGTSYTESIALLSQLSPVLVLRTINQANIAYLISVDWQSKRLLPQLLALLTKVGMGFFAVSKFQIQGIITIAIISEIILLALYAIQILRHSIGKRA